MKNTKKIKEKWKSVCKLILEVIKISVTHTKIDPEKLIQHTEEYERILNEKLEKKTITLSESVEVAKNVKTVTKTKKKILLEHKSRKEEEK